VTSHPDSGTVSIHHSQCLVRRELPGTTLRLSTHDRVTVPRFNREAMRRLIFGSGEIGSRQDKCSAKMDVPRILHDDRANGPAGRVGGVMRVRGNDPGWHQLRGSDSGHTGRGADAAIGASERIPQDQVRSALEAGRPVQYPWWTRVGSTRGRYLSAN